MRTPTCRHFGRCGGCSTLDVPIGEQIRAKVARVSALLAPHLGEVRVQHARARRVPRFYRTKLLYPVRPDRGGRPILGIYEPRSHDVVRIRECQTQVPALTELGVRAERVLRELELEPWDEVAETGFVRAFAARIAPGTGELLIGVVTRPGVFPAGPRLAARLLEEASGLDACEPVGVVRSISERPGNFLLGDRNVPLRGRDYQEDRADGLTFRMRFGSFYQVHRASDQLLYQPALAMLGPLSGLRVVDAYGGIGTFGLRCARTGAVRVEIVEENPVACGDAEHNAKANRRPQATVVRARFADVELEPRPDVLITDPPRSGLGDAGVARVRELEPARILHVACSAEALARDLDGLAAAGWQLRALRLCDLFPHTEHVELLALLERD